MVSTKLMYIRTPMYVEIGENEKFNDEIFFRLSDLFQVQFMLQNNVPVETSRILSLSVPNGQSPFTFIRA